MELPNAGAFFKDHATEKKFVLFFASVLCFLRGIGTITKHRFFYMKKLEDLIAMNLRTSIYERIFHVRRLGFKENFPSAAGKTTLGSKPGPLHSPEDLQAQPKQWADRQSQFLSESINRNILIQKAISDVNLITFGITQNAFFFLRGVIFAVGGISMILYSFPQLLVYTGIYLGLFSLRSNMFNRKLQALSKLKIQSEEQISAFLGEGLSNGHRLRQRQNAAFFKHIFNSRLLDSHAQVLKLASVIGSYFRFLETYGVGLIVGILSYGSYLISTGALASEDILLSLYAVYGTLGLRSINNALSEFRLKSGILESLEEFLGTELDARFDESNTGELNRFCADVEAHYARLKLEDEEFLASFDLETLRQSEETREVLEAAEKFVKESANPVSLELRNVLLRSPDQQDFLDQPPREEGSASPKLREVLAHRALESKGIYSLTGKSGSGKTSVMKLILGSDSIAEGTVEFFPKKPLQPVSIFYMPQTTHLFSKNILFNVLATNLPLIAHLRQGGFAFESVAKVLLGLVHDSLRRANLHNKVDLLLLDEDTKNLSGGEKQRVSLAGMFFSQADLVLIDEGTASLDAHNVQTVSLALKEFLSRRLGIIISHDSNFLDFLVDPPNKIVLSVD